MKATITIPALRCPFRVGVTEDERAFPQILELDLTLAINIQDAAAADDLSATVDYVAVHDLALSAAAQGSWKLIETLAAHLSELLLSTFPLVQGTTIKIRKEVFADSNPIELCVATERG